MLILAGTCYFKCVVRVNVWLCVEEIWPLRQPFDAFSFVYKLKAELSNTIMSLEVKKPHSWKSSPPPKSILHAFVHNLRTISIVKYFYLTQSCFSHALLALKDFQYCCLSCTSCFKCCSNSKPPYLAAVLQAKGHAAASARSEAKARVPRDD